jgi:membrane-associated phospholipid phosphatase
MSLVESLAVVLGGAALANLLAAVFVLDRTGVEGVGERLRESAPYLGFLAGILVVNKVARDLGPELSWIVGWNVTGLIYRVEGAFVAQIQSVATPWLTAFLSAVYLVGYVFLLTFPFVAYLTHPDRRVLQTTAVAYGLNYGLGLLCYTLFISYGPRNLVPDMVDPLLYGTYPQAQLVTSRVNVNTNVFPSLHTSLSTTTALLAWRTRDVFPRWAVVAVPLAACVTVSTMYLGIHWATDVLAGLLLGGGSLLLADRVVG